MVITELLERNARLYRDEIALVEVNPSEERDSAVTWREFSLIERNRPEQNRKDWRTPSATAPTEP